MSKTKTVETFTGQSVSFWHKTFQHWKNWILRNTHHHQPFDFYKIWELPKTLVAELRKTWVSQKQNRAILRKMTFANDCANCCFFRAKLMRNKRKILRFVPQKLRKSFANVNPTSAFRNAQVTCREATIENNQFSNLSTLI